MAELPLEPADIIERFGPHRSVATEERLDAAILPDKAVKTHCCFCGQQCGVQLLVQENQVVGIEPWTEFPFNQGKLCPKGVKRYLQGATPTDCCTRKCAIHPHRAGSGRCRTPKPSRASPGRSRASSNSTATTPSPC